MADLLVPVDCFPHSLPSGVRKVLRCAVCMERQTHYSGCDAPAAGDRCTSLNDCDGRATEFVDLSAPLLDERGEPTRLDALPWAIGVLLRRLKSAKMDRNDALGTCFEHLRSGDTYTDGTPNLSTPFYWYDEWRALGGADFLAGVDLTGPSAARAFVAAALRAGVGLEQHGGSDV